MLYFRILVGLISETFSYFHVKDVKERKILNFKLVITKLFEFLHIFIVDFKNSFDKFNKNRIDSRGIEYDYFSIMHYGNTAYTKNGLPTMQAKKRGVNRLGNNELSELDIRQTNLVYKCDGRSFISSFYSIRSLPKPAITLSNFAIILS